MWLFILLVQVIFPFSKSNEFFGYHNLALLGYRSGVVGNESFLYFYIHHTGNIIMALNSSYGDADMYISETNMYPSYSLDSYDLHSATCGQDVIVIPSEFESPISVGIYGHPAYESSSFLLEIFGLSEEGENSFVIIDDVPHRKSSNGANQGTKIKPKPRLGKKIVQSYSHKIGGLFSLFEIIQLIFL
ncbi:hypothetical protein JTB14_033534 [Gonioctena quinquepunctata]|nr:hypothetical protein JTB14_033534 [Gonioctena quinquepunctata]